MQVRSADAVCSDVLCSEITAEGKKVTKLDSILLNGSNIAIVSRSHTCTILSRRQRLGCCTTSHSCDGFCVVCER